MTVVFEIEGQEFMALNGGPLFTFSPALSIMVNCKTQKEVAYARRADPTSRLVLSRTLDKVAWKTARIVRDVEKLRRMKEEPGKNLWALGGATLMSSLLNLGLIDEFRLMVNPLVLGGGKALFKDVKERHVLTLMRAKPLVSGKVSLIYRMRT